MRLTRRICVSGRVQGVFYRDWTVQTARALKLDGWVRNCRDGSVEIMASGSADALDAFAAQCREGSSCARVEAVVAEDADETVAPGFHWAPTA